jgi:protein disulfide-isomerase A1
MKLYLLLSLVATLALTAVIPFNNDAIEKVFKESSDALFLFQGDEEGETAALEAFKAYEATNPGFVVSVSSKNDGHGLYERLAEYLGVDLSDTPKVLFLSSKQEKFRFEPTEITAENLANFVSHIRNGEIEAFLKSAPIPESNEDPVKVIVGKTFKQLVLDTEK